MSEYDEYFYPGGEEPYYGNENDLGRIVVSPGGRKINEPIDKFTDRWYGIPHKSYNEDCRFCEECDVGIFIHGDTLR